MSIDTPSAARRYVAEAIGTFFLVLIGPGAAVVNNATHGTISHAGIALAFAFVVAAMIYALGHVSGAHINPAVTLAFWSRGVFPAREVPGYIIAQLIGATVASFALAHAFSESIASAATVPAFGVTVAVGTEFLLSFGLMFVIMSVATDDRVVKGFAGLAIGITVGFEAMAGGPVTGASMNPARSFGPALASHVWTAHWLYWVAPIAGAMLSAFMYDWLTEWRRLQIHSRLGSEGLI
ncbi:MAG: MIP family channel protein [Longimicrobiales bacterium]